MLGINILDMIQICGSELILQFFQPRPHHTWTSQLWVRGWAVFPCGLKPISQGFIQPVCPRNGGPAAQVAKAAQASAAAHAAAAAAQQVGWGVVNELLQKEHFLLLKCGVKATN